MVHTWYWPEGLDGIGHISHDSDGNSVNAAELMLEKIVGSRHPFYLVRNYAGISARRL